MTKLDSFLAGAGISKDALLATIHFERDHADRDGGLRELIAFTGQGGIKQRLSTDGTLEYLENWINTLNDPELLMQWQDLQTFY